MIRRTGGWIRDGWLMIGVTLVMLFSLEVAYRAQADVRHMLRKGPGSAAPQHPYTDSAWYPAYSREYEATFGLRWRPYVYFRRPAFAGAMINVDTAGHRRTVSGTQAARDTVRVFFFGGSTAWGTDLRDSSTIPSVLAGRLAAISKPGTTFDVTNFGESGYVFTQEVLELEMQLRSGNVPDLVVFLDGINDVASAVASGEVGIPQNERNRAREFAMGRAIYGTDTDVGSDWKAAKIIAGAVVQRLQLVQRVVAARKRPAIPEKSPEQLAREQVAMYVNTARIVESLGREFGFRTVYVWQPTLQTTPKQLTRWEQGLEESARDDTFGKRLMIMHRALPRPLTSAMRGQVGGRFVDASSLFGDDPLPVFTDVIGHNTEAAIPTIVDAFLPAITPLLDSVAAIRGIRSRHGNQSPSSE